MKVMLNSIESLTEYPSSLPFMAAGILTHQLGLNKVIVHGNLKDSQELIKVLNSSPKALQTTIVHIPSGAGSEDAVLWLSDHSNMVEQLVARSSSQRKAVICFCQASGSCSAPVSTVKGFKELLL